MNDTDKRIITDDMYIADAAKYFRFEYGLFMSCRSKEEALGYAESSFSARYVAEACCFNEIQSLQVGAIRDSFADSSSSESVQAELQKYYDLGIEEINPDTVREAINEIFEEIELGAAGWAVEEASEFADSLLREAADGVKVVTLESDEIRGGKSVVCEILAEELRKKTKWSNAEGTKFGGSSENGEPYEIHIPQPSEYDYI